ncbi:MAG: RNA pseudouridine synthase [Myxococcales bacterium]|nr:RNA pseudouridine synthase [Myxococcales bacterium]
MGLRNRWRPGDAFLIRHKDAHIVVVEKRAGMLTHAGPGQQEVNLLDSLRDFLRERHGRRHLKALHRLDRVVSGLLVFSRTESVFQLLRTQFAERSVIRSYIAGVQGQPLSNEGRIEHTLDIEPMTVRVVPATHQKGRTAALHYQVRQTLPLGKASILDVRLETGLRNQIRVQLAALGHPLLGEKKYGHSGSSQGHQRIFLHAAELGFVHPVRHQPLHFTAALPPDLNRWLTELKRKTCQKCPPPRFARKKANF